MQVCAKKFSVSGADRYAVIDDEPTTEVADMYTPRRYNPSLPVTKKCLCCRVICLVAGERQEISIDLSSPRACERLCGVEVTKLPIDSYFFPLESQKQRRDKPTLEFD